MQTTVRPGYQSALPQPPAPVMENAPLPRLSLDLPTPVLIGHRGGQGGVIVEESMTGFRACALAGAAIELDVQALSDGTLVVMHDNKVLRTCYPPLGGDGNGWLNALTAADWRGLRMWNNYASIKVDEPPPFFADVLREFGNKTLILAEIKVPAVKQTMIDALIDAGVSRDFVIPNSFNISDLDYAISKGFRVGISADAGDPDAIKAAGVEFVSVSMAALPFAASCSAAGLKVMVYNPSSHYDYAAILAAVPGIWGIVADDVNFIRQVARTRASDAFGAGGVGVGDLLQAWPNPADHATTNPSFGNGEMIGTPNGASFAAYGLGWAYPLANTTTITGQLRYVSAVTADRFASIFVGANDHGFTNLVRPGTNGYQFILRKNGQMQAFKITDGAGPQIGATVSSAAIADGAMVPWSLAITPTGFALKRTDTNDTLTIADSTYRPLPYLQIGQSGSTIGWSNIQLDGGSTPCAEPPATLRSLQEGKLDKAGDGSSLTGLTAAQVGAAPASGPDDIEITDAAKGVILRAPGGGRYRVSVDDTGTLSASAL